MVAWRCVLGSSAVILVACTTDLPLGERANDGGQQDSGTGGAGSGGGGSSGAGGSGGSSGAGGSGGTGGAGGVNTAECMPKESSCYPSGRPGGPGSECLAQRDNSIAGNDRVQIRSVWTKAIAPLGNTTATVYDILRFRSQINWPTCGSAQLATGGFIQLTDWDRSNPDPLLHTLRTGFATYHTSPAPGPAVADVVRDGLCMIEHDWTAANDPLGELALPLGRGLPYPWRIRPVVSRRVTADFDARTLFPDQVPEGEGRVFINEQSGYMHGYSPLAWITVLDTRGSGIAIPIRHLEVKTQFNDNTFNCAGRFRAEALNPNQNCDSSDPQNPQWGCKDDRACPPPGLEEETGETGPGAGATLAKGYFLILDLERVYSLALGRTLCVGYSGDTPQMEAWKASTDGRLNCRNSPNWDPAAPNDAGLPPGDWCSTTNAPATATCHDAWRSVTFGAEQAFKIKDGTCPLGTL